MLGSHSAVLARGVTTSQSAFRSTLASKFGQLRASFPQLVSDVTCLRLVLAATCASSDDEFHASLLTAVSERVARTHVSKGTSQRDYCEQLSIDASDLHAMVHASLDALHGTLPNGGLADDVGGLLKHERIATACRDIERSLGNWLAVADHAQQWANPLVQLATFFALHVGEDTAFCTTFLGSVVKRDQMLMDEVRMQLEESVDESSHLDMIEICTVLAQNIVVVL